MTGIPEEDYTAGWLAGIESARPLVQRQGREIRALLAAVEDQRNTIITLADRLARHIEREERQ